MVKELKNFDEIFYTPKPNTAAEFRCGGTRDNGVRIHMCVVLEAGREYCYCSSCLTGDGNLQPLEHACCSNHIPLPRVDAPDPRSPVNVRRDGKKRRGIQALGD